MSPRFASIVRFIGVHLRCAQPGCHNDRVLNAIDDRDLAKLIDAFEWHVKGEKAYCPRCRGRATKGSE